MKIKRHPIVVVSWLMLAFAAVYVNFIPTVDSVPLRRSFIYFPYQIGDWKGTEKVTSDYLVTTLGADDILMREYTDDKGDMVEVYFAYFRYIFFHMYEQDKGPHPPQTCWVGSGWKFTDLGEEKVQLQSQRKPQALVKAILAERDEDKTIMLYLYKINEKYVVDWGVFRGDAIMDSVLRRKNAAFTLQLSANVGEEGVEYRKKEMTDLLAKILSILERDYLP